MSVNIVAAGTATVLGVATIATAVMAASVASTVATVAFTVLAITLSAFSIASITAWIGTKNRDDVGEYFQTMQSHLAYSLAGTFQFVAQTLVQTLVKGLAEGVGTALRRKIAGPDITVETTEKKKVFA